MTHERRHELFQQFQHLVAKRAKRFPTLSRHDLTQLGYVKLIELVDSKGESLTAGVVDISLKNLFIDELRRAIKNPVRYAPDDTFPTTSNEDAVEYSEPSHSNQFDDAETLADIDNVFAKYLTDAEHQVMSLRWTEGYTTTDVAAQLGVTIKTVQRYEDSAFNKLTQMSESPTLTKELWRIVTLTAIANGSPNDVVARLAAMAQMNPKAVVLWTKTEAKKLCTALRKAGY